MSMPLPMLGEDVSRWLPQDVGDEPGFGSLETERGRLPLEAMEVCGRIDGLLSQVTVRQTFVNALDEPLEATYIFPLPDRAAVTRFRMEVAGRVIEGLLEERGQAREQYDQAIAAGHRAAIAEEERPGVFTLRVGNLMPGEAATVELTYCGVLPYSDGEVTFRFPLVVAPRYIPGVPLPGPVGRRRHGRRYRRRARRLADLAAGPAARLPQSGAAVPGSSTCTRRRRRSRTSAQPARRRRRGPPGRAAGSGSTPASGSTATSSCGSGWADRRFVRRLTLHPDADGDGRGDLRADDRAARPPMASPRDGRATWSSCSTARAAWRAGRWWRPAAPWPG